MQVTIQVVAPSTVTFTSSVQTITVTPLPSALTIISSLGATGPVGPTGLTGATGPAGATGPQGIQGVKGDTGAQGIQGITGDVGPAGPQGIQGVPGTAGSVILTAISGSAHPVFTTALSMANSDTEATIPGAGAVKIHAVFVRGSLQTAFTYSGRTVTLLYTPTINDINRMVIYYEEL